MTKDPSLSLLGQAGREHIEPLRVIFFHLFKHMYSSNKIEKSGAREPYFNSLKFFCLFNTLVTLLKRRTT